MALFKSLDGNREVRWGRGEHKFKFIKHTNKSQEVLSTALERERSDALMEHLEGEQARGNQVFGERVGSPHAERGTTTQGSLGPDHSRSYQYYYLG